MDVLAVHSKHLFISCQSPQDSAVCKLLSGYEDYLEGMVTSLTWQDM